MKHNGVWDFVELQKGCKRVGCKWVFKTKRDSHCNLELTRLDLLLRNLLRKMTLIIKRRSTANGI